MAVRRVSDLPNLSAWYPNAQLSNCLMEVSYAKPEDPRRYQSFYRNMGDMVVTTSADIKPENRNKTITVGALLDYLKAKNLGQ